MMHDDAMLDSVAVLALGALPASEATSLAAHVRTCAECSALYGDLRGVADLVGFEAELASPVDEVASARLKSRIMRVVNDDAARSTEARPNAASEIRRSPERPPATAARRPIASYLAYAAAAAAVIVATVFGTNDAALRGDKDASASRIAVLESQQASLQSELARTREHDSRLAALVAPGSRSFSVSSGQVVTSNGRVLFALHLPKLPAGHVYQAWTLAKGAKTVKPSVTFSPDTSGLALVELPEAAAGLAAVALSVEPAGGSAKPTTTPKFVRPLG